VGADGTTAMGQAAAVSGNANEPLSVLTPVAEYEPSTFISEPVLMTDKKRPHWSRRLWALTDDFLIQKPARNKNTVGSD
jgi:hypothetical protein